MRRLAGLLKRSVVVTIKIFNMAKIDIVEFEPIEIKDYSTEVDLKDDLTVSSSPSNDFKFTESLEFDQQVEGIVPGSFLPGSFNSVIDATKGFEIKTDKSNQISYFQTKDFELNQKGWQLDSFGNITGTLIRTSIGSKRVEMDGVNNRISFYHTTGVLGGAIEGNVSGASTTLRLFSQSGGDLASVIIAGGVPSVLVTDGLGSVLVDGGNVSISSVDPVTFDVAIQLPEIATPAAAPPIGSAFLYVKDNGAGKQQLAIKWDSTAESIIATQP